MTSPQTSISSDAMSELMAGLLPGLWSAAGQVNPDWDYLGIFFWCDPGHLRRIQECVTAGVSQPAWPREPMRPVEQFLMLWWEQQRVRGARMWEIMFVACRRESGDVESFFAYPENAAEWAMPVGQERVVMDRAYARVGWHQ